MNYSCSFVFSLLLIGTEESSRETSTNVDTSSPLHTPGSPLSPGSNQGTTSSANFFHAASLQRNHKLDPDAPGNQGGSSGLPPPMERSISVQEQRPNSAVILAAGGSPPARVAKVGDDWACKTLPIVEMDWFKKKRFVCRMACRSVVGTVQNVWGGGLFDVLNQM